MGGGCLRPSHVHRWTTLNNQCTGEGLWCLVLGFGVYFWDFPGSTDRPACNSTAYGTYRWYLPGRTDERRHGRGWGEQQCPALSRPPSLMPQCVRNRCHHIYFALVPRICHCPPSCVVRLFARCIRTPRLARAGKKKKRLTSASSGNAEFTLYTIKIRASIYRAGEWTTPVTLACP